MKKRVPILKTEATVDEFWGKNDFTDYAHDFEKESGAVRIDPKLAKKIKDRANKKHLSKPSSSKNAFRLRTIRPL